MSVREPKRLSARKAHALLAADPNALLVCAYEEEGKFWEYALDGAISLQEFSSHGDSLSRETAVIFYCDSPRDEVATREARKRLAEGFTNLHVLAGGVSAWRAAGYPSHVWASILADLDLPTLMDHPMPLV